MAQEKGQYDIQEDSQEHGDDEYLSKAALESRKVPKDLKPDVQDMSKRRLDGFGKQIIGKIQDYQKAKKEEEDKQEELANELKSTDRAGAPKDDQAKAHEETKDTRKTDDSQYQQQQDQDYDHTGKRV